MDFRLKPSLSLDQLRYGCIAVTLISTCLIGPIYHVAQSYLRFCNKRIILVTSMLIGSLILKIACVSSEIICDIFPIVIINSINFPRVRFATDEKSNTED